MPVASKETAGKYSRSMSFQVQIRKGIKKEFSQISQISIYLIINILNLLLLFYILK